MTPAPARRAWDRRPGETGRSWATFNTYLRLGPARTLAQAAATQGNRHDTVRRWSAEHDWTLRAAAYDEHMQAVYTEAAEDEAKAMAGRHVRIATLAQSVVARELAWVARMQQARDEAIAQAAADGTDPPDWTRERRMSVTDAARLLQVATQLERGAVTGPTMEDDLAGMSPDEIRAELAAELGVPVERLPELPG